MYFVRSEVQHCTTAASREGACFSVGTYRFKDVRPGHRRWSAHALARLLRSGKPGTFGKPNKPWADEQSATGTSGL